MEGSDQKRTCEERIDEELKGRLEQFLPEVENWSRSQCQSWLKAEGHQIGKAGPAELRESVLELTRERAGEHVLGLETITVFRLCLSWGGPADD